MTIVWSDWILLLVRWLHIVTAIDWIGTSFYLIWLDKSLRQRQGLATGIIGELGFGTQLLPFSGKDIQDEKIFGTCHVATGRSDHLGGNLTPDLFNSKMNASHDDILYAPPKTPEITVTSVKMHKNGDSIEIFSSYEPTPWLLDQISTAYPVECFSVLS